MKSCDDRYIWQAPDWPNWRFDLEVLVGPMAEVRRSLDLLLARMTAASPVQRDQLMLTAVAEEVVKTSEIESEQLDVALVRSSVARQLGTEVSRTGRMDPHVDGVVKMVLDASIRCTDAVSQERLVGWQAALFPLNRSFLARIKIGDWRDDVAGPMQVVSGPVGRQRVHFEAPPADRLATEMRQLLDWLNSASNEPPLIKAGIAHLWFVTLHPFEDGNGRVGRAICDLLLARADNSPQRFYSLSAQIRRERNAYYELLERSQKGSMDVTEWLIWFLDMVHRAVDQAHRTHDGILTKAHFWQKCADMPLNDRQVKVLNRLVDGFDGKLTCRKWAAIAKCSTVTALSDISDLVTRGLLLESATDGRSTSYVLPNKRQAD
ncbi:DUF4172 domain-containing protein [Aquabacterium olei]|uniref:DUF4172 domain-containing protein n=1 Tax=Aquabacterium olei TaxID=1296669 RepID=A0A2U8FX49_9BURK|nr:Fic family protein [Aquabacterium olei]AWI54816.1 DUF4172 domain-containing protein [Aquabacterium olei]